MANGNLKLKSLTFSTGFGDSIPKFEEGKSDDLRGTKIIRSSELIGSFEKLINLLEYSSSSSVSESEPVDETARSYKSF